ncbi:MAG: hypothetical protein AcusKO_35400 [Acuticoccus sp.]
MKHIALALALVAFLAGCNSNDPTDRALGGAAIGGASAGLIAAAAGANAGTTLGVAAAGAAGGAIIGAATAPERRRRCVNRYGERVRCP